MIVPLLCFIVCILSICNICLAREFQDIVDNIHQNIDHIQKLRQVHGWNDNYDEYYVAFLENTFKDYIGDEPIFIYELMMTESWGQLGNRLGHYFEALTLCKKAGLHFVGFVRTDRDQQAKMLADMIPRIVKHPQPVANRKEALIRIKTLSFQKWPWSSKDALLFDNTEDISKIIKEFTIKLIQHYHPNANNLVVHSASFDHLVHNDITVENLPLFPDAVILVRCSDLIRAGGNQYGILNFNIYPMIIPRDVKNIYILSEPLNYGTNEHAALLCERLVGNLVTFLAGHYQNTTIGIRRGHPHDGLIMLGLSKYVVCAPSTFCLWPGIGNTDNNVYYHRSNLIASGNQVLFHQNFNWISFPKMYSYCMTHDDAYVHPIDSAEAMTKMLSEVHPRCATCDLSTENTIYNLDDWDCNK